MREKKKQRNDRQFQTNTLIIWTPCYKIDAAVNYLLKKNNAMFGQSEVSIWLCGSFQVEGVNTRPGRGINLFSFFPSECARSVFNLFLFIRRRTPFVPNTRLLKYRVMFKQILIYRVSYYLLQSDEYLTTARNSNIMSTHFVCFFFLWLFV